MDCKQAQQHLITPGDPSPELREHLETCGGCREFAADLESIRGLADTTISTPPLLRERTLDVCRTELAQRTNGGRVAAAGRLRAAFDSPRFVAATALIGVALLVTTVLIQVFGETDPDTGMILKITIVQIVLQNLVAALFLPALLKYRNRQEGRWLRQAQTGE